MEINSRKKICRLSSGEACLRWEIFFNTLIIFSHCIFPKSSISLFWNLCGKKMWTDSSPNKMSLIFGKWDEDIAKQDCCHSFIKEFDQWISDFAPVSSLKSPKILKVGYDPMRVWHNSPRKEQLGKRKMFKNSLEKTNYFSCNNHLFETMRNFLKIVILFSRF